jgi:hypothetical protein
MELSILNASMQMIAWMPITHSENIKMKGRFHQSQAILA